MSRVSTEKRPPIAASPASHGFGLPASAGRTAAVCMCSAAKTKSLSRVDSFQCRLPFDLCFFPLPVRFSLQFFFWPLMRVCACVYVFLRVAAERRSWSMTASKPRWRRRTVYAFPCDANRVHRGVLSLSLSHTHSPQDSTPILLPLPCPSPMFNSPTTISCNVIYETSFSRV